MSVTELGYNASTELLAVRELPAQSDEMVDIGADPTGFEAATLAVGPQNAAAGGIAGTMGGTGGRVAVVPVSASHPLEVRACTPDDFELVLLAPRHVLQPKKPTAVFANNAICSVSKTWPCQDKLWPAIIRPLLLCYFWNDGATGCPVAGSSWARRLTSGSLCLRSASQAC
jgi:hypothetical protein